MHSVRESFMLTEPKDRDIIKCVPRCTFTEIRIVFVLKLPTWEGLFDLCVA